MSDPDAPMLRRSSRSAKPSDRASAIERLKALRQGGGRRSSVEVKLDEPIYDTVGEEDYARLVAQRRASASGFIVDDGDLGYGDEGEEEDWAHSHLPADSDEEGEDDGNKTNKKSKQKKNDPQAKKPPRVSAASNSLSAAAALMGKQRLSAIFTSSSAFKRTERTKAPESIVDDLIAEFAPDETDREERRRKRGLIPTSVPPPSSTSSSVKIERSTVSTAQLEVHSTGGAIAEEEKFVAEEARVLEPSDPQMEEEMEEAKEAVKEELKEEVKEEVNGVIEEGNGEVKAEMAVPKVEGRRSQGLNAKIEKKDDGKVTSATAGWKAISEREEGVRSNGDLGGRVVEGGDSKRDESSEIPWDSDGKLPFFLLDAHEESFGPNSGRIYLFGKVKAGSKYHSCCVVVNNVQRCVYAIPKPSVFPTDVIVELQSDLDRKKVSIEAFRKSVQEMAAGLKNEITQHLLDLNVSTFSMMPVKRSYAFERSDIPIGEQYVLKINYPFKERSFPSDLKGELFHALLGTNTSALELFLVKRKIQGPSWLSISKLASSAPHERVSWCKFEVVVDSPKDLCVASTSKIPLEIPPVVATAINLKTIVNEKHGTNEIVSASIICCNGAKIDGPMLASEWKRPGVLSHFTVLRKLDGCIFPMGFTKEVQDRNFKAGSDILSYESSERALINRLMIELNKLDADVLVGHNISGFDLDVLLHRAQACKVPSIMWSKIGRLRRSVMPKLTKGSSLYGSGASLGIQSCIAGRLLCDTYVCSRDLLREVSYSLTQLARTQLNKERKEITSHDIPSSFQASGSLLELVEFGETDAWLSLELMFHLSILPLTRQLTNISGNLWGKTLQGARAQRVEFLLLHAFHAKKYLVPDKNAGKGKEFNPSKRRMNASSSEAGHAQDPMGNDVGPDDHVADYVDHGKGKKGAAYAGGLVLEPKRGLYDKIVLLLDFNSLYPSIIQEYNICFTTVERSDGSAVGLPSSRVKGVLPELLSYLVERRKSVKKWLKTATGLRMQQLDIQQQALKLTANSIYGCLGFSNSRFYAKEIAELITLQGREILQNTVDLVQNVLNLEVIYGDTDSIMINSGLDDFAKAKAMAGKVIQEVNKKYVRLEIDLDGIYKRMLLLKKKKYAAVKVLFKDGVPCEVIERKGLDMVRRDWSLLSKETGDFCLCQILSGGSCEEVIETIHSSLMKVQEEMNNGEISLEKYIITKTLTKPPEEYSDAKNQPHVQVALRLKQSGYSTGFAAGDTVPYIICNEKTIDVSSAPTGIAERARHPDELRRENGNWMIDIDYYLSQQIHPVVSRLCASIEGTSPARLADCLGLDSSKFQNRVADSLSKDRYSTQTYSSDDDRYHGCEPLRLSCPGCSASFDCPPVYTSFSTSVANQAVSEANVALGNDFWDKLRCPRCPDDIDGGRISSAMLANQVKRQAENYISFYYKGCMVCDDDLCKLSTRNINLRVIGDSERGTVCPNFPRCNGHLMRQYTEADLYKQLSYFYHIFDIKRHADKLQREERLEFEKKMARIQSTIEHAAKTIGKIRERCAYGWVKLEDISVSV